MNAMSSMNSNDLISKPSEDNKDVPGHGGRKGRPLELDDVLINELGQFGRYQLFNILMVSVVIVLSSFAHDYNFSAAAITHRCRISECGEDNKSNLFSPEWIPNAIPTENGNNSIASCSRFKSQGNGTLEYCPADIFTTITTDCNEKYVYASDNSIVYDFNLGCKEWLRALPGTLNSIGTLIVMPITGYLSDRFGRRLALVINAFNLALFGLIRAFSVNYAMYAALQILQTSLGGGIFSTALIFATEFVGPRYRVASSAVCSSMFAVGQMILGGIAWLIQPWRYLIMVLYIPGLFLVFFYWILAESVRWQLSKGKFAEAKVTLETVARINKKQISEKSMNALMNPPQPQPNSVNTDEVPSLIKAVFKSRVLLGRVLTTPVWWITVTFVYYGLSINSIGLSDTMYLNFILVCAIEIPGNITAALILDRVGRKVTLAGGYFLSAICNITFIFIPQDLAILRLVVYLFGKFGISIVVTSVYLYTTELYPTQYRHRLLAFSSTVGRIGSITAPLTPVLRTYWHGIPSAMFAGMAILSGLLVLTQPETLGTKLPDTLEEAEAIGSPESMRENKP